MSFFYDEFAPLYHLIFQDWDASIERQGEQLKRILQAEWPGHETVLDVSCGIGTQSLALVWDFEGEHYDFTLFLVEEDLSSREVRTHTMRSRYHAVSPDRLLGLLREAGFQRVARRDEGYYQPVLLGTRPSKTPQVA